MAMKLPAWTEPAVWAFVIGALGWWLVLAFGLGWMSAGAATKMSTHKAHDAVVAYATPVCLARFEQQPNVAAAWQKLKKADSWDRDDLLIKDGWVAEPGQKLEPEVANSIADTCVGKILALKTLGGEKISQK